MLIDNPELMTLPRLAQLCGRSTSGLRDLKNRNPDFPRPDNAGRYTVARVAAWFELRRLESLSDEAYAAEQRAAYDLAARLPYLDSVARRRLKDCPIETRLEAIADELAILTD